MPILGCLHTTPIICLYDAYRVTGHSAFLIRDIICKLIVGFRYAPVLLLLKDTNLLNAPRTYTRALTYICVHKHLLCVRVRCHSYTHAHASGHMHTNVHTRIMHVNTHTHSTHTYLLLILVSRADISKSQHFLTAV